MGWKPTNECALESAAILAAAKGGDKAAKAVVAGISLPLLGDRGSRHCGDCTACCHILATVAIGKPYYARCEWMNRNDAVGCSIYEDRPLECRSYECSWLMGLMDDSLELRPDELGIMFNLDVDSSGKEWIEAFEVRPNVFDGLSTSHLKSLTSKIADAVAAKLKRKTAGIRLYRYNSIVGIVFDVNVDKYPDDRLISQTRTFYIGDDAILVLAAPIRSDG